ARGRAAGTAGTAAAKPAAATRAAAAETATAAGRGTAGRGTAGTGTAAATEPAATARPTTAAAPRPEGDRRAAAAAHDPDVLGMHLVDPLDLARRERERHDRVARAVARIGVTVTRRGIEQAALRVDGRRAPDRRARRPPQRPPRAALAAALRLG